MKHIICNTLLFALLLIRSENIYGQTTLSQANNSLFTGISNQGRNKEKPYVTAGDRTYIIGTMNGDFPDIGGHIKGEMGGIWMHPIKLLDGYFLKLTEITSGKEHWLSDAYEFLNFPYGNIFRYNSGMPGLFVKRMQFCPDGQQGVVIEYEISNADKVNKDLTLEFLAKTDLSPVWFSKEIGIRDYCDHAAWSKKENCFIAADSINNWHAVWGSSMMSAAQTVGVYNSKSESLGKGIACSSVYHLAVAPHASKKIIFVVAGSTKSEKEAIQAYKFILQNYTELLSRKKLLYHSIYNRAQIIIPDSSLLQVYSWVKVNTQWLVRQVAGIGRGLGAGLMEYPWWFGCDNTYSLQAVMETGDFKLAEETLRLLKNKSVEKNGNGRIPHEISTNGAVANPGNTQETAHFIMCVEKLYRWTGNEQFLREMYPTIKNGLHWLLTDKDQNQNLFPEGYGIMEVSGLNAELIDVAVYTQQALVAASKIAGILHDREESVKYKDLADTLKNRINEKFWDEKAGSYCDFFGTKVQAITAINGSIRQQIQNGEPAESDKIKYYKDLLRTVSEIQDTSRGWIINKNWVINTPLETGIAPQANAIRALDDIYEHNSGDYGPYLSAVERKHMMTIATGVQAVSEYMYGRTDKSLYYINDIVKTFGEVLPGSISEMMPNYGCFTQAWTSYGIVLPLISHVFGINPDASQKRIEIAPHIPDAWSKDPISIHSLPVADNEISMSYQLVRGKKKFTIVSKQPGWKIEFRPMQESSVRYVVNGKPTIPTDEGLILLTKRVNQIVILLTHDK